MSTSHWSVLLLRVAAVLAAAIAFFQMFTGFGWVDGGGLHPRLGEATTTLAAIAAIGAFVWSRRSGDKGLFWHALGMTVLGLAQIAIGHMHLTLVHQILGVVYLLGLVALVTLSIRKPGRAVEHQENRAVTR